MDNNIGRKQVWPVQSMGRLDRLEEGFPRRKARAMPYYYVEVKRMKAKRGRYSPFSGGFGILQKILEFFGKTIDKRFSISNNIREKGRANFQGFFGMKGCRND